ncbi:MAG: hypothetical protein WC350_05555 [Candidatus Micrarchaeia archaeon]|jgi:hypothetical protein
MAFSATLVKKGIIGDLGYSIWTWIGGTDATGVIHGGVGQVVMAPATNSEAAGEQPKVELNTGASGAVVGDVKLTFVDGTNNTGSIMILGRTL